MKATLEMRDDSASHLVTIQGTSLPEIIGQIDGKAQEWVEGGEWGDEGASVRVSWRITSIDGKPAEQQGSTAIEVAPDVETLIRKATRGHDTCGYTDDVHDWTSEGEGGCQANPGVWQIAGTKIQTSEHCRRCGLHKTEVSVGSEHDPGEHDTVTYTMLDRDQIAKHRENGFMDDAEEIN